MELEMEGGLVLIKHRPKILAKDTRRTTRIVEV